MMNFLVGSREQRPMLKDGTVLRSNRRQCIDLDGNAQNKC